MLCTILYMENSDKARFSGFKKRVENDYGLNKAEYPRTVAKLQSLLLNYQTNYNSDGNPQSNGVSNQLMSEQCGKTGEDKGDREEKDQRPRINLDHITCKNCGEKGYYSGNSDCPTQAKLKEDAEEFRKTKQEKYAKNPPGGGYQKAWVIIKYAQCSLMMGAPTKEWGKLTSPILMFCQT